MFGPNFKNRLLSVFFFTGAFCVLLFSLSAYKPSPKNTSESVKQLLIKDVNSFTEKTRKLSESLQLVSAGQSKITQAQDTFYQAKQAYKRIEFLVEYLDAELAKSINGAPLPKVAVNEADYLRLNKNEPAFVVFQPEGLQVIEELIFADETGKDEIEKALALTYKLQEKNALFAASLVNQFISEKQVLESIREQMIRVMTMGITGFDAPAAGNEMANAAQSLQPVLEVLEIFNQSAEKDKKQLLTNAENHIKSAILYLTENTDFETFDRLYFIRDLGNPSLAALTKLQNAYMVSPKNALALKPLNNNALNLFDANFLNAVYYAKQDQNEANEKLTELGKLLFFDPVLSANNERSCASCHNPEKAFTDGRQKSVAFDVKGNVNRNSPSLLNVIFSKAYFWDGRVEYLQDQVPDVVSNKAELHGSYKDVVQKLQTSYAYRQLFKGAFNSEASPLTNNTINRAIAAYIQSLVALNSPIDKYMRKETDVLNASAKNGFNLFMGKAACGTCHFAPVFNGTVPPKFIESEHEVLGTTASSDLKNPKLDNDLGRYNFIKAYELKNSFKTPTVRNAKLTAPYMHNGALQTLEQVIDFYNEGGGAGLGLDVPNQTLPADKLNLTEQEKLDLIAFLEALTDNPKHFSAPQTLPKFPAQTKLNGRKAGGNY